MKNGKGLILVGLVLAITVLAFGAVSAGWYCSEPTKIVQNPSETVTITVDAPEVWFYESEVSSAPGVNHDEREQAVLNEILTSYKVDVDFYVYGQGYYDCWFNRWTKKITVILDKEDVPSPGTGVALRFSNVECDRYDQTVYAVLPKTLLNEDKIPQDGDEIPLTSYGVSPRRP